MLNIEQREKVINKYLRWIASYQLSHTPEAFLEWLLIHNLIHEEVIKGEYND